MDQSTSFLASDVNQPDESNSETSLLTQQQQMQPPPEAASLKKVNEVFATASHAFSRLSELVLQIHTTPVSQGGEQKWTMSDADYLKNSLQRFADDMEEVSKRIRTRTGQHIKADFKRRAIQIHNQQVGNTQAGMMVHPSNSPLIYNGGIAGTSTGTTYTAIGQKRPAAAYMPGGQPKRIMTSTGATYRSIGNPVPGIMRQRQVIGGRMMQPGQIQQQRYYEPIGEGPAMGVARTNVQMSGNSAAGTHY